MTQQSNQLAFALTGSDKASFVNFWPGSNSELVATIQARVELKQAATENKPRVTYFYGPSSAGKSHLLFAAIRHAQDMDIVNSYLSLSDPYVSPDMLAVIDVANLVCIDDVDAWAGDKDKERALFTLFEQIKHASGQLLLSAKQPPELSEFVIPDLVSRLSSGLIYPLHELDDEQRFDALKMRAKARGLSISDDAVRYLLSRSSRDTGALFDVLDQIDHASLVEQRRVTIPFLQSLLTIPV